jgi:hypothetical protein
VTSFAQAPEVPPSTSTGPTARTTLRRNRGPLALAGALVLVLALLALVTGVGKGGELDPKSYGPSGARALATLLEQQGVQVVRTTDVISTVSGVDRRTVLFVPQPQLLSHTELRALASAGAALVVAGAGPDALAAMEVPAGVADLPDAKDRDPDCSYPVATDAGRATTGGWSYVPGDGAAGAVGCYPVGAGVSLLVLPDSGLTLLGSGTALTNDHLDEQGNAALGLGLLGQGTEVRWFIPAADRDALGPVPPSSPTDLLPDWVRAAVVQLGVALLVLALWRARRLGRVVTEPLPVIVRAAETVEGRGRLYRAAGSRETAAEALRSGTRDRVARRVGAGRSPQPELLVDAVAARTSRSTVELQVLLYGPSPADDAALVRLADDLDALTQEVAGS